MTKEMMIAALDVLELDLQTLLTEHDQAMDVVQSELANDDPQAKKNHLQFKMARNQFAVTIASLHRTIEDIRRCEGSYYES